MAASTCSFSGRRVEEVEFFITVAFVNLSSSTSRDWEWRWLGLLPIYFLATFPLMETTVSVPVLKLHFHWHCDLWNSSYILAKSWLSLLFKCHGENFFSYVCFPKHFHQKQKKDGKLRLLAVSQCENFGNTFNLFYKG